MKGVFASQLQEQRVLEQDSEVLEGRRRVEPIRVMRLEIVEVAGPLEGGDQHPVERETRRKQRTRDHRRSTTTRSGDLLRQSRHVTSSRRAAASRSSKITATSEDRGTGTGRWPRRRARSPDVDADLRRPGEPSTCVLLKGPPWVSR